MNAKKTELDNGRYFSGWYFLILVLAGTGSFVFHSPGVFSILTAVAVAVVLLAGLRYKTYKKKLWLLLLPFASGLMCFMMKLPAFYWDGPDFRERVDILLGFSLIVSLGLAVRRFRLMKKFYFFFNRLPLKKRLVLIFVVAELAFIAASVVMIDKGVKWGGDEPHYLVISHSLARDMDLNVFNQYARDEYREFVDVRLQHHARVGKGYKVWYSYGHLPGLSATLAPFFTVKTSLPLLYYLVRAYLGLFGAALAVLAYLFALRLWQNKTLAVFITGVFTFTAPVFFNSIHVFAELQAAFFILLSLYLVLYARKKSGGRFLLAGFFLGMTVFWGLKYAIFIFFFSAGFFFYYIIKKKEPAKAILFVVFPVLFMMLFLGYLYMAYGSIHPMNIYNGIMTPEQQEQYRLNMKSIPLQKRVETLLGILFDQRDGLFLYAPFYLLAFPGVILALKRFREYWPQILISGTAVLYILFLGYSTVRAGYCPQARYLAPVAWMFMLFSIIYYKETKNKTLKKIALYLPLYSFGVVLYQVFSPFTLYQSATHINLNRPALMFQEWSNIHIDFSSVLPSFIKVPGNFSYWPNIVFFVLLGAFIIWALQKTRARGTGVYLGGAAIWGTAAFLVAASAAVLFPRIPVYNLIDLSKDGAIPCKIYGESRYPTRAKERTFEWKRGTNYSFTVSTLKQAPVFVMEWENKDTKPYNISIGQFDKKLKTIAVQPGGVERIRVRNPFFKRFRGSCFYRFHFGLDQSPPRKPSLFFRIYPVEKRR